MAYEKYSVEVPAARQTSVCNDAIESGRNFSKVMTRAILIAVSIVLVFSRAAHTLLAQPFKKSMGLHLNVPIYHTMLEAVSFPLAMIVWVVLSYKENGRITLTNWQYRLKMYTLMALVDSINIAAAAVGLNILPATVYTIIKASSIVFSVSFSRLMTNKQFTWWHYSAAMIMVAASSLMAMIGNKKAPSSGTALIEPHQYALAFALSLVSAMSLGLLGVITYKFTRHEKVKESFLIIAEMNAFQSLIMFFFLLPLMTLPEVGEWSSYVTIIMEKGHFEKFVWCSLGMFMSRPFMLFASIATTTFGSAALTRALGGPRRLFVILFCHHVFNEELSISKLIATILMCLALGVYVKGGFLVQAAKKKAQQQAKVDLAAKSVAVHVAA